MRLAAALLHETHASSDVLPGNLYPAHGGRRRPGTHYWLVVAVTTSTAHLIGFDEAGNPVSTASYVKSAMRERPVVGRVDLAGLELGKAGP